MKENPVALVTGSASGFGKLIALELARSGYYVLATMRNVEKADQLLAITKEEGIYEHIEVLPLDVTDATTIKNVVQRIREIGRIDVLVNNAGFAMSGFVEEVTIEEYKKQFETNFFGLIAVTQQLVPIFREQRRGKIINISSISGLVGFPGLSPYVSSKYAVEGFCESLRIELKPFHVDVALIEPGSYQTNIWTSGRVDAQQSISEHSPYRFLREKLEAFIANGMPNYGDPIEVAKLVVKVAKAKKTKLRYKIGKGTKGMYIIKKLLPWRVWEKLMLKQLNL